MPGHARPAGCDGPAHTLSGPVEADQDEAAQGTDDDLQRHPDREQGAEQASQRCSRKGPFQRFEPKEGEGLGSGR